ncbi:MAG: hypothetical protein U0Q18_36630 [Bryobacteraceae bacterium]
MRNFYVYSLLALAHLVVVTASAQIVIDPRPARLVGHSASVPGETVTVTDVSPNLVEGHELYLPQGVAVDTTGSSPILYVSDTGNNRILAWKNATSTALVNLQNPDKVIGQPNFYTTLPGINGTGGNSGLNNPSALFVDSKGNLYIADVGNSRIIRYPAPFSSGNQSPDLVLGQSSPFATQGPNQGHSSPTASTLWLQNTFTVGMAADSGGNLWVTDTGNRRVLRYPAASLTAGSNGPSADLVLGQADFVTAAYPQGQLDRSRMGNPAGLAFDSGGRLFVSDASTNRLMVFASPFNNGQTAVRLAGIDNSATGTARTNFSLPEGIVMINDGPAVMDTGNNRILIFDSYSSPDWATKDATLAQPPPAAITVYGQANYTTSTSNGGNAQPSAGTMSGPTVAAVSGSDLFLADSGNNRILVFAGLGQGGAAAKVLGQRDFPYNAINYIEGKEFNFGPNLFANGGSSVALWDAGIAIDWKSSPQHLYVSDPGNNRVLGFMDAAKIAPGVQADIVIGQPDFYTSVCNYGGVRPSTPAPGQLDQQPTQSSLCYPVGLAVDPNGNLYVADSQNGRVVRFPAPFASGKTNSETADLVLGQSDFTGLKNPTVSASFMGSPYGLVYDVGNGLLVSDRSYNRVLLFSKDNLTNGVAATKVIGQSDFSSQATTTLWSPYHIAEDSNSRIYVADSNHGQVLIFGSLTDLSTATTVSVNALTGLNQPRGVWVNPTSIQGYPDDIWVGDYNNGVLRYPRYAFLGPAGTNNPSFGIATAVTAGTTCGLGTGVQCLPALAIAQDKSGNLFVADYSNRVSVHYQAVASTNGASFICAGGCNLGGLNETFYYLAPGAVGSVFGFSANQFGSNSADFRGELPVPTTVGDIQVLVSGIPSPIFHVVPNQVNFVVPWNVPTGGFVQVLVTQKSTGQVLGSGSVQMYPVAPAMFTSNQTGIGQIAALNQDNSKNSSSNPAARGSVIQLFGTGQGKVPGAPGDGQLPTGLVNTPQPPAVFIGGSQVPSSDVTFSGLAPCCVGLWQLNVTIPKTTAPGNNVSLVVIYQNAPSFNDPQHITTIAVKQ